MWLGFSTLEDLVLVNEDVLMRLLSPICSSFCLRSTLIEVSKSQFCSIALSILTVQHFSSYSFSVVLAYVILILWSG